MIHSHKLLVGSAVVHNPYERPLGVCIRSLKTLNPLNSGISSYKIYHKDIRWTAW